MQTSNETTTLTPKERWQNHKEDQFADNLFFYPNNSPKAFRLPSKVLNDLATDLNNGSVDFNKLEVHFGINDGKSGPKLTPYMVINNSGNDYQLDPYGQDKAPLHANPIQDINCDNFNNKGCAKEFKLSSFQEELFNKRAQLDRKALIDRSCALCFVSRAKDQGDTRRRTRKPENLHHFPMFRFEGTTNTRLEYLEFNLADVTAIKKRITEDRLAGMNFYLGAHSSKHLSDNQGVPEATFVIELIPEEQGFTNDDNYYEYSTPCPC